MPYLDYREGCSCKLYPHIHIKTSNCPSDLPAPGGKYIKAVPTFDEWFKEKNGNTFEETHMMPGAHVVDGLLALARELRDYASEMMQQAKQEL